MSSRLHTPWQMGKYSLANRIVMAPMTRSRALGNVPNELMAQYYAQRADAGLIITEGTAPSPHGLGYARIPGLFNKEQVTGWRLVTDAVHAKGGRIFVQLMHTGRISHPLNMQKGSRVLAPSAVAAPGQMYTDQEGLKPLPLPEEMTKSDIRDAIAAFADAAELATQAGFDGVELHGANGYLIEQFLAPNTNKRADDWGGSVEGRIKFPVEVAKAVVARIGRDRVGMRISPFGTFNGIEPDHSTEATYLRLSEELSKLGLIYLHVIRTQPELRKALREAFKGTFILAGGYDGDSAEADLAANEGDLVAFGRPFIANPRLVTLLAKRLPLKEPDVSTFYTPGERGYADYA